MHKSGVLAWALLSAAAMAIGVFGPWLTALSLVSFDGWHLERHPAEALLLVAILGGLGVFIRRSTTSAGVYAMIAGIVGLAVGLYEHHHITSTLASYLPNYPQLTQALFHVGWGLDAAIAGSASLALAGLASFFFTPTVRTVSVPTAQIPSVPAGWYTDPSNADLLRYWNGFGWTTQTAKPAS
ncbi:MAG: DUF2510 domain-containing protein [Actinobacteria bacterium]|nr:DUF2510 domain-containing protein [Actinomycetota bacterium]MBV8479830.1 DUF2510 domain-containing protein [Actinomycetota bacterium]MBV8599022.1 DUF2510 domain-containing protein [Actinomycetota bacterium]